MNDMCYPNSMKNIQISIVLGSYNRRKFLEKVIESVRGNDIKVPYEIIVVDGGSTDKTLEWLSKQKDIITIVQHNRGEFMGRKIERRSWGYFMNLAFKCAHGKYILMISDDALLVPNAVMNGYDLFEKKLSEGEKVGGVAFYFRNWPEDKKYYVNFTMEKVMMLNHGLYLKKALEEAGYIDEDNYVFYHADDDLALKMKSIGYECIDSPDSYAEHCLHINVALRNTNAAVQPEDFKQLLKKWGKIYNIEDISKIYQKIEKEYHDPFRTANKFRYIYYRQLLLNKAKSLIQSQAKRILSVILCIVFPGKSKTLNNEIKIHGFKIGTKRVFLKKSNKLDKETFIIRIKYGGLGDHLFWSHLPRIAKEVGGYKQVYISNRSDYRNLIYRKFIWELNPFVDGFCNEDGLSLGTIQFPSGMNILDAIMLYAGLDDGVRFHEPEIFYQPKLLTSLAKTRIFDPNYISNVGVISDKKIDNYLFGKGGIDFQMRARDKTHGSQRNIPILDATDIFDYCDMICSCKEFFCLASGGATLAAALRKSATVFYGYGMNYMFRHTKMHYYLDMSPPFTRFNLALNELKRAFR